MPAASPQLQRPSSFKVRRSEPTRPGHSGKMMQLAAGSGADVVIFDLEMVDAASLRVEWKKLAVARKAGLLGDGFRWKP